MRDTSFATVSSAVLVLWLGGCRAPALPPPAGTAVEERHVAAEVVEPSNQNSSAIDIQILDIEKRVESLRKGMKEAKSVEESAEWERQFLAIERLCPRVRSDCRIIGCFPMEPDVHATILASNPGLDLCLISVGEKDGMMVGHEMSVYRGDTFVALVLADKVFADKTSIVVKRVDGIGMKIADIRVGDRVESGVP